MHGRLVLIIAAMSLTVAWISATGSPQSWASPSTQAHKSERSNSAGPDRLRGVFLGEEKSKRRDEVVGRVSILLLKDGRSRHVGIDHIFRSGDRFRFEIASSRDGWLTILHRSPGGELQVLWPQPQTNGEITASNHVRAKVPYVVPPSPGLFIFDNEVGKESFYVAVEAELRVHTVQGILAGHQGPEPFKSPGSGTSQHPRKKAASTEQRIVNFKVRGGDADGLASRGVVFDPGPEDFDPNVYFSASTDDDGTIAVLEFQLRHQE